MNGSVDAAPCLAVVAYPTFDEVDRGWLESFRAVHDPQAHMLAAHFTRVPRP